MVVNAIREGVTVEKIFAAWQTDLVRQGTLQQPLLPENRLNGGRNASNLDAFFVHTLTANEGLAREPLRAGTAIGFEPQALWRTIS